MLKNKRFLLTILVALLLLLIPSMVNAADEEVNITSVEVTTPSGVYGAGQQVTIRINFDKAVKGIMPKVEICFNNEFTNKKELTVEDVATPIEYVDYTYTIVSGENGKLTSADVIITEKLSDLENVELTVKMSDDAYSLGGNTIFAETTIARANLSNAEFEWVSNFINMDRNGLGLKMKNVTTIEDYNYYYYISNNKDEQINVLDSNIWKGMNQNTIYNIEDIVAANKDIYVWVCEKDNTYYVPKILVNAKKIERLPQLPIGKRMKAYFFDDYTSTYCWETQGENERKLNVKIGMITDKSILRAVKNGEANALQRLLDYSKSAEAFYIDKISLGRSATITDKLNLIDDEYYYVYFELDDENGKYYPIEDISLFQALILEGGKVNLFDCLDDDYEWNLDEEGENNPTPAPAPTPEPEKKPAKTEDKTTAPGNLPYTGGTFVIIVSVLAIIALGIYAYRRNNDLKGI